MSQEKAIRLESWTDHKLAQTNERLGHLSPSEIVAWSIEQFPDRLALSCSFGGDGGTMLAHLISSHRPRVPVLFLDTGLLFGETLAFKQELIALLDLEVIDVLPQATVEEQAATLGPRLWERDPNRCCHDRKVRPMQDALKPFDAWMTGIQRGQTSNREHAPIVALDRQYDVVKINALVKVSRVEIETYLNKYSLPRNPLRDQGYVSIGCWPCTTPVATGEDPRAGRWRGVGKTECGLHTIPLQFSQEKTA